MSLDRGSAPKPCNHTGRLSKCLKSLPRRAANETARRNHILGKSMSDTFRLAPYYASNERSTRNQCMTFKQYSEKGLIRRTVKHNSKRNVMSPIFRGWAYESAGDRRYKPRWKKHRQKVTRLQGRRDVRKCIRTLYTQA